jgi:hypothetical protein
VTLHAVDSEVTFEDSEGAMSIDLNGGLLALNAGSTSVTGGISDADLQLVSISGMIRLTGAASSIWIINHSTSPIQLAGTDLRITIDNTGGRVNANLKGGRFDASGVGDRIDFQLSAGAEADVRDLASDIAGSITDGSRMVIDRVVGHTRIRLQDSELELSRLKSLELNAVGGFITGTEIRALIRVETDGSDLDLTLPTLGGRPTLVLKGSSTANVQIPTPCQVMAKVPAAPLREQVRVTGCQLDFDGARKGGIRRGLDGREPVRLSVAVEGDATVRVDGNP